MKLFLTAACFLILTGCLAFGVPYTSDRDKKFAYAYMLMNQGRAVPAEKLIGEALKAYQESGTELGAAEAYHTYGNFYKNDLYHGKFKRYFESAGTYDGTYERSLENFQKVLELYAKYNDYPGVTKSSFGLANVYGIQDKKQKACETYDLSLTSWDQAKRENPDAKLLILTRFSNVPDMIDAFKKKEEC